MSRGSANPQPQMRGQQPPLVLALNETPTVPVPVPGRVRWQERKGQRAPRRRLRTCPASEQRRSDPSSCPSCRTQWQEALHSKHERGTMAIAAPRWRSGRGAVRLRRSGASVSSAHSCSRQSSNSVGTTTGSFEGSGAANSSAMRRRPQRWCASACPIQMRYSVDANDAQSS